MGRRIPEPKEMETETEEQGRQLKPPTHRQGPSAQVRKLEAWVAGRAQAVSLLASVLTQTSWGDIFQELAWSLPLALRLKSCRHRQS